MAGEDDTLFANLPLPRSQDQSPDLTRGPADEHVIGGFWDANLQIPRETHHRANHASWNGKWFASKDALLHDLVQHPHGYIGDPYGKPTRPDSDDNIVLPGHAYNCQCSLKLVYDLEDVPKKYLTSLGRRALKGRWV